MIMLTRKIQQTRYRTTPHNLLEYRHKFGTHTMLITYCVLSIPIAILHIARMVVDGKSHFELSSTSVICRRLMLPRVIAKYDKREGQEKGGERQRL